MAADAHRSHPQREGPGGALPVHVPGHHCAETADRRRRFQR